MKTTAAQKRENVSFRTVMETLREVGNSAFNTPNGGVTAFLRAAALHTGADRAILFALVGQDQFNVTFSYDALLDSDEKREARLCTLADFPQMEASIREDHAILTWDVETLRDTWPKDYAWLRAHGVHSCIAFPTTCEGHTWGYVALDNPVREQAAQFVDALPLISAYLGMYRTDLARRDRLAQYEQVLRRDPETIKEDRSFLDVFCRDYTSIYQVDLRQDLYAILKVNATANAANMTELQNAQMQTYTAMLRQYAERYVVPEQREGFLQFLERKRLLHEMTGHEGLAYRYQSLPNAMGHQHFEVQVVRFVEDIFDGIVFLGFRSIDNLVSNEMQQRDRLQRTVEQLQASNEVLTSLGKIYYAIFWIDLEEDIWEEIASESDIHHRTGRRGRASEKMQQLCRQCAAPEYQERIAAFFDLTTLPQRMGKDETLAMEFRAVDGNWHTARFIVKRRDEEGKVTRVIYVAHLISDLKRREKNWIAIANEANEANKAKSEFISQIAHDIRTPLNAIMGFSALAESHLNEPQALQADLEKIRLSGGLLTELVNNVLDLSRIEKGKLRLAPEPTDLRAFFDRLNTTYTQEGARKGLAVKVSLHDLPHPVLLVDALRLTQVYGNLLSNAVKYTREGGTVELEACEKPSADPEKTTLVVTVRDTGIGMSEEYKKNMYAMFTRETDTRINQVQGYGLGLSIVKQLTDRMGGKIEVESTQGKGTTFCVTLEAPIVQAEAAAPQPAADTLSAQEACRGMHLLVAEDNDLNYEVVSTVLQMHGVSCERAEDGSVCIEKFKLAAPGTYDAILMDMQMPVMNGLQAASVLRGLDSAEAHTIPIIAMTANAFKEDVESCLNAGMNAHLAKPFEPEALFALLAPFRRQK